MFADWSWRGSISKMMPPGLTAERPSLNVRVMLVAEVALFMAVAVGCLWLKPTDGPAPWYYVYLWIAAVTIPIVANVLHGDCPADSGLRLDNLRSSGRWAMTATLILGAAMIAIGLIGKGRRGMDWGRIAIDAGPIFLWGFAQQYLMQAFVLRRLRQSGVPAPLAVAITVLCFGIMHLPNPTLVGVTLLTAVVWCILFIHRPNLFALAASHCILTLLMRSFWPETWHLGLAVGPKAIARACEYGWW